MEHTQGKWEIRLVEISKERQYTIICNFNERNWQPIANLILASPKETEANARLICQCVNSYDALLEACKAALPLLEKQQAGCPAGWGDLPVTHLVKQAIKQATGD